MKLFTKLSIISLIGGVMLGSSLSTSAKDFTRLATSDNGDGTFNNPVLFGDFPDMDVVLVGDTYYMVSTTMFIFPGATVLKSKDLVNWEYCANPLKRIENSEPYNLENGKNRYSHGQWATSLQYHDGKFYMLFLTLDEGGFLLTAEDPEGDWEFHKLPEGFYDCGIMFDGDKTYVAYGIGDIHIAQVDENFHKIKDAVVAKCSLDTGMEGCRLYHIGDYYYIYATYPGWPGRQTILRSKDLWGSYEEKMVLADNTATHQGALVQTPAGEWWTLLFRDNGTLGRMPFLLPVKWVDGWPVIGTNGTAGEKYTKPLTDESLPITPLPTNDPFRTHLLGKQWGWNHNDDMSKWSLTQRPGYMRLYTAAVTNTPYQARNTLTQRVLAYHSDKAKSYGTIAADISHITEGDVFGFGVFQDPMAFIGIKMVNGKRLLMYRSSSLTDKVSLTEKFGPEIDSDVVYLRAVPSHTTGKCNFYYSLDNKTYQSFGPEFKMEYDLSVFTGNKFAIFNYATQALGGYVDIDWFTTEPEFEESEFYGDDFDGYPDELLTVSRLELNSDPDIMLLTGSSSSLEVKAIYMDGHSVDVTTAATYESSDEEVVKPINGRLTALKDGTATVKISYAGEKGLPATTTVNFTATSFPIVEGMFNPNIWEKGTFDEATHEVTVGQYGFAGWQYSSGIDLSDYKYCVAKVSDCKEGGLSFRLFDIDSYWTDASENGFDKNGFSIVNLQELKSNTGRKMDPSHIYIVGFWGYGHKPFILDKVYLSNSDDPASVDGTIIYDADAIVDVYTVTGIPVRKGVIASEATTNLPAGIYIVGDRKVIVKD
ncbi:MAG: glycoside hydrolase 43 family protein [Muribaculaceae bacterium]|nr:glycoside hydrolase 43 family protein [Muribaculaceae bacterium]